MRFKDRRLTLIKNIYIYIYIYIYLYIYILHSGNVLLYVLIMSSNYSGKSSETFLCNYLAVKLNVFFSSLACCFCACYLQVVGNNMCLGEQDAHLEDFVLTKQSYQH